MAGFANRAVLAGQNTMLSPRFPVPVLQTFRHNYLWLISTPGKLPISAFGLVCIFKASWALFASTEQYFEKKFLLKLCWLLWLSCPAESISAASFRTSKAGIKRTWLFWTPSFHSTQQLKSAIAIPASPSIWQNHLVFTFQAGPGFLPLTKTFSIRLLVIEVWPAKWPNGYSTDSGDIHKRQLLSAPSSPGFSFRLPSSFIDSLIMLLRWESRFLVLTPIVALLRGYAVLSGHFLWGLFAKSRQDELPHHTVCLSDLIFRPTSDNDLGMNS